MNNQFVKVMIALGTTCAIGAMYSKTLADQVLNQLNTQQQKNNFQQIIRRIVRPVITCCFLLGILHTKIVSPILVLLTFVFCAGVGAFYHLKNHERT